MKNRILFALFICVMTACATNPYRQFYTDRTGGVDVTKTPNLVVPLGDPKMFAGTDPEADAQTMRENGYGLLGFASFNAGPVNQDMALVQGRDVHAEVVVAYSKYTHTVSGVMPLTLPNTQTSQTSLNGSTYGSGGFNSFNGTATSTTYGTQTTYVPYSVNRSDYFASYWIKQKTPVFGANVTDLTTEQRRIASSNKGVQIMAVVKGSPAFNQDFLKGDVIKKINDHEIIDANDYHQFLLTVAGQKVTIDFIREGKHMLKEVQLNSVSV